MLKFPSQKRRKGGLIIILVMVMLFGISALAQAGGYPTKPVEIVVPFPPGGSTDIIARIFAESAKPHFEQPFIVSNTVGGVGVVGVASVARAKPDGYTLLCVPIGSVVLQPHYRDLPYDRESFIPIGQISSRVVALAVRSEAPWDSLSELLDYARQHPGKVTFACAHGVVPHLCVIRLSKKAGVTLTHIPYGGDTPAITAVLGGHADMCSVSGITTIIPQIEGNTLKALAVFSEKRDPRLPNVPTAKELGYDVVAELWTGLAAPAGTPQPIIDKLRRVLKETIEDPSFVAMMKKANANISYLDGEKFGERWAKDLEAYGEVMKELGLGKYKR